MVWIIFGGIAVVATFLNLYLYISKKDYKLAMALGLSFTALALCAEHSVISNWVKNEDWSALLDVVPTLETTLWTLTIISIFLNILPIISEKVVKRR